MNVSRFLLCKLYDVNVHIMIKFVINSSTIEHPYMRTGSKLKFCKSVQKNNSPVKTHKM